MMKNRTYRSQASFEYAGKTYSGYIVSSTDIEPHFHWFLLEDQGLVQHFGDSIAFQEENGELRPVHHVSKHSDLVDRVKYCVECYLAEKNSAVTK